MSMRPALREDLKHERRLEDQTPRRGRRRTSGRQGRGGTFQEGRKWSATSDARQGRDGEDAEAHGLRWREQRTRSPEALPGEPGFKRGAGACWLRSKWDEKTELEANLSRTRGFHRKEVERRL